MVSLVESLDEKYGEDEEEDQNFPFIVFVSCSPEAKRGLLPHVITLNDFNIERLGNHLNLRLNHIGELDLTDNLLSDWAEVVNILTAFPHLYFLNLSNNLLNQPIDENSNTVQGLNNANLNMRKLVLNGNNVSWPTIVFLCGKMARLEELHLSANNLQDLFDNVFQHERLRFLYLSCNYITDFNSLSKNLVAHCPRLILLSLAECPIESVPEPEESNSSSTSCENSCNSSSCSSSCGLPTWLQSLNVSTTRLNSWEEVDKFSRYPGLSDLRIQGCPFLDELTAHERRMMLIARLPNIKVLNGGDEISALEREDAERAFIRFFLDTPEQLRPPRFNELVKVHGLLQPLVNIDLKPEVNILVKIYYGEEKRQERISVRQTVKQFKLLLQNMFHVAPGNMRLYYYDQEMSKVAGPEEMKWNSKELYTYNVREGDYFVLDEKVRLRQLNSSKTARRSNSVGNSNNSSSSDSCNSDCDSFSPAATPKGYTSLQARSGQPMPPFGGHSPGAAVPGDGSLRRERRSSGGCRGPLTPRSPGGGVRTTAAKNLFGGSGSNRRFGEFHHSKVFHDHDTGN